jgi:DNA replication protein DnaC
MSIEVLIAWSMVVLAALLTATIRSAHGMQTYEAPTGSVFASVVADIEVREHIGRAHVLHDEQVRPRAGSACAPGASERVARARGPPRDDEVEQVRGRGDGFHRRQDMLREPTMEKLQTMRLGAMAAAWTEQQRSADTVALTFDERFAMLVDAEWMMRENKKMSRALKEAKLRIAEASIEGIDYPPRRELDKAVVRQLRTCTWVEQHQVVLISGAAGTGKTYVSCALAQQACRKGFRAMYRRAPRLFDELRLARADGSYPRLLSRIARVDVLVIDDFAIAPVADSERRDLLEVLEDRYAMRATVISSQLPPDHWHAYLADPTVADAICDRVLHGAHRIALKGPSRRKDKGSEP